MNQLSALALVQSLLAPVVIISACGLLCLAFYNRLAAIVSRARAFNRECHDLRLELNRAEESAAGHAQALRRRLEIVSGQAGQILHRARLVRGTLVCLLLTILCMLGCSLAVGLANLPQLARPAVWATLGCFGLGMATLVIGILLALAELATALDPVAIEWREGDLAADAEQNLG